MYVSNEKQILEESLFAVFFLDSALLLLNLLRD